MAQSYGRVGRWLLPVLAALVVPAVARAGDAALDKQIDGLLAEPGDAVRAGIWFGAPSGEPLYQRAADQALPAASVVKTAILVELFAAHAGHLDEPLGAAADAVLADDKHGAMAPLSSAPRCRPGPPAAATPLIAGSRSWPTPCMRPCAAPHLAEPRGLVARGTRDARAMRVLCRRDGAHGPSMVERA